MRAEREEVIRTARECPRSPGCLVKVILSLGLYLIWWLSKTLIVTNHRVAMRSGLIGKSERSIILGRVQDVTIHYTILGRILGYGSVRIESAGGPETEIVADNISDPEGIKNAIVGQVR